MFAGPLDRRLTWQRATSAVDDFGGDDKTWTTVFETWCAKVATRGLEAIQSQETVDEHVMTLQFRYRAGLLTTDRVLFEGRTWRVQAITEIGRREGHEVILRTRADTTQVAG